MNAFNWDDLPGGGNFVKFAAIGDTVKGTIVEIRQGTDFNSQPCAVIDVETQDGPRTITCAQANLKAQVKQLKPQPGQVINITYARDEKAEKGTKKIFDIKLSEGIPF